MPSLSQTIRQVAGQPAIVDASRKVKPLNEAVLDKTKKDSSPKYNDNEAAMAYARAKHYGSGPEYNENMADHFNHLATAATEDAKAAKKAGKSHEAEMHQDKAAELLMKSADHSKRAICEDEDDNLAEEEFHHRLDGEESHRKEISKRVHASAKTALEHGLAHANARDAALKKMGFGQSNASKHRETMKINDKHVKSFLDSRHGHHIADEIKHNGDHESVIKMRAKHWIGSFDHRTHMNESAELQEGSVLNESSRHEREAILHHAKAEFAKREGDTAGYHHSMSDHHIAMQDHHMSQWKAADAKKDKVAASYHMKQANKHSEQMDHHVDQANRHQHETPSYAYEAVEKFDEDEKNETFELIESHASHKSAADRLTRLNEKHPHTLHHIAQGRRTGRYFVVRNTQQGAHIVESVQNLEEAKFDHREAATQHVMHPSFASHLKTGEHADFYHPSNGDKEYGKVLHNDGKSVHILHAGKTHKFTVKSSITEGDESEKDFQDYMKSRQKPKLDPVGKEDADVNNDGKKNTSSDKFIKNRRATIAKAIAKEKK